MINLYITFTILVGLLITPLSNYQSFNRESTKNLDCQKYKSAIEEKIKIPPQVAAVSRLDEVFYVPSKKTCAYSFIETYSTNTGAVTSYVISTYPEKEYLLFDNSSTDARLKEEKARLKK